MTEAPMTLLLALAACDLHWFDGGASGNEGTVVPPVCQVVERTSAGVDVSAPDFGFAPQAVVEATEGDWSGWVNLGGSSGASTSDAILSVEGTTSAFVVRSHLVGVVEDADGNLVDVDAVTPECPPYYELVVSGSFMDASGALNEDLSFTVTAPPEFETNPHTLDIVAERVVDDIEGTLEPDASTAGWNALYLQIRASLDETGALIGGLWWVSPPDANADDTAEKRSDLGGFALTREP